MFTTVYSCLFSYVYSRLLYVYTFYLRLPLFSRAYLCLLVFTYIQQVGYKTRNEKWETGNEKWKWEMEMIFIYLLSTCEEKDNGGPVLGPVCGLYWFNG